MHPFSPKMQGFLYIFQLSSFCVSFGCTQLTTKDYILYIYTTLGWAQGPENALSDCLEQIVA